LIPGANDIKPFRAVIYKGSLFAIAYSPSKPFQFSLMLADQARSYPVAPLEGRLLVLPANVVRDKHSSFFAEASDTKI
jgi:hypothetical protein